MDGNNKYLMLLLWIQGGYFFITGVWPLVHIYSFMVVSGPKNDIWLVRTVGLLITSISLGLLTSAIMKKIEVSLMIIAFGSALSLLFVDLFYVFKNVIAETYLGDALVEFLFIISWLIIFWRSRK
ncbi:hypothetical protein ACD_75C02389G0003 [Sporocytophaga myxococcoides]|uniref:Uncharacterized protein n=1 Tax=Sporocytophaga myxococcoides TaxID=153721 RepID=A0A098LF33_9BACT|nr:hypothetical protein [Sporocytophaga myxococcoides]GAL85581.1 hypothetical protein ACD_75C02389G0003 [Sporocytophaga myxococcoides]